MMGADGCLKDGKHGRKSPGEENDESRALRIGAQSGTGTLGKDIRDEKSEGEARRPREMTDATTILQLPFVQVALPILIGFVSVGAWQNKRLDDIIGRLDRMEQRLGRIEEKLDNHAERIVRI